MCNCETGSYLTTILFTLTYIGLAMGEVPGLQMDRAGIALVGATLMLVTGMLSLEEAVSIDSIDYKTLTLLFGMMVVISFLRLSGFFQQITALALRWIRTPVGLLAVTITLSGVLSAFLINDIVCLTLTPLVLHLARRLRFDPIPHLIALATAANIGSTGTITGNPQNIFVGSHSCISYVRFAERLLPVAFLGLMLDFLVVVFVYRRSLFSQGVRDGASPEKCDAGTDSGSIAAQDSDGGEPAAMSRTQPWLLRKSVAITLATVVLFFSMTRHRARSAGFLDVSSCRAFAF
jgi:Na+/H+ antiporter NhaD/arsenite permease-like protein